MAGVAWSFFAIKFGFTSFTEDWIAPFGVIFMNLLKLIAVPLVMFSIITGVAGLSDMAKLGRMGAKTIVLYSVTTLFAISLGLGLVNLFKPGDSISKEQLVTNRIKYEKWRDFHPEIQPVDERRVSDEPAFAEFIIGVVVEDDAEKKVEDKIQQAESQKGKGPLSFLVDIVPDNIINSLSDNGLLLQVIFFSIFFGIALKKIPPQYAEKLLFFFEGLNHVYLAMVEMIMTASPFLVFSLMAGEMVKMAGDNIDALIEVLLVLTKYGLVVIAGLAFLLFVVYPSMFALFGYQEDRTRNFFLRYLFFLKSMGPAQLLAFSTSSSAATLPLTIECVNKNLKVSKETTSFVLPIGATINMDGTSLYQAVAVVFLAQFHWIDLTFAQQMMIVLTAVLASIGSAAVPSAGLIMLIMVLQSVNLNPAWIAIILPIDRILDMCRTVINVSGDGLVASLVERWEQKAAKKD